MKNIVIVGGGYAGINAAKSLEKKSLGDDTRILLIETRSHFYHSIGALRAGVQPLDDRIFIPYSKLFNSPKNKVIQATVTHFDEKVLYLNTQVPEFGNQISFDFLIIATGTRNTIPGKLQVPTLEEGKAQLQQVRQHIEKAEHILVIGAGAVGIELVGEIRQTYPSNKQKKVTLIHNEQQLGNPSTVPLKMHNNLMKQLVSSNVDVILGDKVNLTPPSLTTSANIYDNGVYIPSSPLPSTENGKDLSSVDLVLWATGNQANVGWIKQSFPELVQSSNGYVKVKPTLQVDHPTLFNVFVIGDAAALSESKMAYRTPDHAAVTTENITLLLRNPNTSTLKKYKKGIDAMVLTYGENGGSCVFPMGIVAGSWVASMIKSKSLFIDNFWKELNQTPPRVSK
ncbi:uncharacterized protein BX664DRAFT_324758 [Halteromyces radiatus]|uniref:uncharacterized protein n=1 Tax=Halteromyces radiatus TaxID=101107 RepID=UPI00221E62C5|nr:uncharacterized protein BX664DRAFT_324758 [Halteromyces radiatus]KAI8096754.1 hypothetical protein BX664DRAFT_324758 [Halteromyces radiatus]